MISNKTISSLILSILGLSLFAQVNTTRELMIYDLCVEPYRAGAWGEPWGKHEALLNGLPSNYDWYEGARPGSWLNPEGFEGLTTWGQVYVEKGGSPEKNYRVQIRNLAIYKYENEEWTLIVETPDNVGGSWYRENFNGSTLSGNKRSEPKLNGGGISITMIAGHNFHWWDDAWPRSQMPHTAEALFAIAEVRLIPDTDPDVDLSKVKVLGGIGMDSYTTRDYSAGASERITSMVAPRHRYVTSEWQAFTSYLCGENPPQSYEEYVTNIDSRPLPPRVINGGSPSISITAPKNDTTFVAADNVLIEVDVTDEEGTVDTVNYYNGDTLLASVTVAPFSYTLSGLTPGNYTIKVIPIDNEGKKSPVKKVSFSVTASLAPQINMLTPVSGTILFEQNNSATLSVNATDADGTITSIEYFVNNESIGVVSEVPFSKEWTGIENGSYLIYAIATDDSDTKAISETISLQKGMLLDKKIRQERYYDIEGITLQSLFESPKYPGSPDFVSFIDSCEIQKDIIENYGVRLSGYLTPPESGIYYFWIAGDDNVGLWLSTDSLASNKSLIAYHNDWTNPREWNKYPSQKSDTILLSAANTYYFEAVLKEGAWGENLSIAWAKPGEAGEGPSEIIPASYFSAFTTGNESFPAPSVSISTPSNSTTFEKNSSINISATASDEDGEIFKVVFYKGTSKLGEDNTAPYSYKWTPTTAGTFDISAVAYDNDMQSAISNKLSITITEPLNNIVNSIQTQSLVVFPNPVKDNILNILLSKPSNQAQISIYDVTGKIILTKTINGQQKCHLNLDGLANSGFYFLKVQSGDYVTTNKIIVE